jgi:2C-methyl-D-erythritol 2,4-cyclodiphosphate synthase
MKINNASLFPFMALLIALIVCNPNAYADPSGGGSTAVSVADTIHSAVEVASLFEEFNGVMAEYESEDSEDIRKELLKKAKNILAKLIEQANNVESEISIMAKKKLDELYAKKLDRVLSRVVQMREAAERKMQTAGQASYYGEQ